MYRLKLLLLGFSLILEIKSQVPIIVDTLPPADEAQFNVTYQFTKSTSTDCPLRGSRNATRGTNTVYCITIDGRNWVKDNRLSSGSSVTGTPNQVSVSGAVVSLSSSIVLPGTLVTNISDGNVNGDPNSHVGIAENYTSTTLNLNPGFTTDQAHNLVYYALDGQNDPDQVSKTTFANLGLTMYAHSKGQKILANGTLNAYGNGDNFIESWTLNFMSAHDDSGGEGTGMATNTIQQINTRQMGTISGVPIVPSCHTVTATAVTGSATIQTVQVVSSAGCNGWLDVDPSDFAYSSPREEAVLSSIVDPTHISGVFKENHLLGSSMVGAVQMNIGTDHAGEGLFLIRNGHDITGTLNSITGQTFVQSGTSWANNMFGAATGNVGCISPDVDSYGLLREYFGIQNVSDNHTLTIARYFNGAGNYTGNFSGPSGFHAAPCARILKVLDHYGQTVIVQGTGVAWTNGDSIEVSVSSDGAITGRTERCSVFLPSSYISQCFQVTNEGSVRGNDALRIEGNTAGFLVGLHSNGFHNNFFQDDVANAGFARLIVDNSNHQTLRFFNNADTADLSIGFDPSLGTHGQLEITQGGIGVSHFDFSSAGNNNVYTWPNETGLVALSNVSLIGQTNKPACINANGQIYAGTNTAGTLSCP